MSSSFTSYQNPLPSHDDHVFNNGDYVDDDADADMKMTIMRRLLKMDLMETDDISMIRIR